MELSANAGNRTGDRTFKQDPRGRLHYSHGSSSTSMLSPHPAVRDAILACRCQFVPLLPSVFVSDAFHLSPSFSILHPGPNPLPFQNGALDFQIIEGNSRKDRGEIASFHLFPLLPTIFFSLTTLVILPSLYRYPRLANGASKIESARSVFSYPFPTQQWIGLGPGKANRGCHPGRTSCRLPPCHLPLHYRCKLLEWDPCPRSPIGFVPLMLRDRPSSTNPLHLSFRVSLLIVLWEIGLGWFVERPLLVMEEIDSLSFFLLFLRGNRF